MCCLGRKTRRVVDRSEKYVLTRSSGETGWKDTRMNTGMNTGNEHWDEHRNEHWEGRLPACHLIVHIANIIFYYCWQAGSLPSQCSFPCSFPVLLPVFIPLVGWFSRASTASLPPARESNGKVNYHTYFFTCRLLTKVKMLQKCWIVTPMTLL